MNNKTKEIKINDILLREPREKDVQQRLIYGRPNEFRKMVGGNVNLNPPYTIENARQWYDSICNQEYEWIIDYAGMMIGTTRLTIIDESEAKYAIGIFDDKYYNRGIGTCVTKSIISFAFNELNLKTIRLMVLAFNQRAIACYKKCGFKEEKILENNLTIGDESFDDVIMKIENE